MTKRISRKAITYQLIAPLALGLILFSGVKGWAIACPNGTVVNGLCIQNGTTSGGNITAGSSATSTANSATDGLNGLSACQNGSSIAKNISTDNTQTMQAVQQLNGQANGQITNKQNATQAQQCQQQVKQASATVNTDINALNKIMSNNLCAASANYNQNVLLHPIDVTEGAKDLSDYSSSYQTEVNGLNQQFSSQFQPAKDSSGNVETYTVTDSSGNSQTQNKYTICETSCLQASSSLELDCNNLANAYNGEIQAMTTEATSVGQGSSTTWTAIKVGEGVAAVGAVVGIVKAVQIHNSADKRAKYYQDYDNGLLDNPDGTQTNCTTAANYLTDACQPVLMNYCSETANQGGVGCQTFNSSYCALTTSNTSYCLAGSATTYCESYSAASPACQWMATRPTSCNTNPNNQNCLVSLSNTQLSSECPGYPNDPVCQAYSQGKVVNQATGTTLTGTATTGTTTTTDSAVSSTFNQVISTGSTTSASTAPDTTTTTSTTTSSDSGGLVARAQVRGQPVANLWSANSGTTVAALCGSSGCN